MNIIDHLSLGVSCIDKGQGFYNELMATLDVKLLANTEGFAAYGKDTVQFLIMKPENQEAASAGNGCHVSFIANSPEAVDNFHRVAVDNGGYCAGEPGPRKAYPIPDVYTCFVRDPFGNKLEAIFAGFNQ
ncbi:VOC family protein [uncultured Pseudoteredinibacter sp.]|uniref:VOC family protein n=1 Tax=uncultured Pseudoteredinibacter sp. TaxID=1641701 RepID=UPI00260F19FF|nr:VOC family protein [uncultured Pseudoteredinibacter sp.]